MWYRIRTLIIKEFQALRRDPRAIQLLIAPVVLQVMLFPFAATLEVNDASIAFLNQDSGQAATEVVQRVAASTAFGTARMLTHEEQVADVVNRQQALLVVRFLPSFSRDIAAGETAAVQIIADGRRPNSAQLAQNYVDSIIRGYAAEVAGPPAAGAPAAASAAANIETRNWYNPNLDGKWAIVPSLVAMMTTIGALITTALSVAREREQGTLDQVLVSPLSHASIMIGKTVPAIIVATLQSTVILIIAIVLFGIPFVGSLLLFFASCFAYSLALAGFGLFISAISQTQQQAFLGVFTFMLPAVLLSGFVSPVQNMPTVLQWISWIDPLRHFIVIVKGLFLKDIGMAEMWPSFWPLLMIAALMMVTAHTLFRRDTA